MHHHPAVRQLSIPSSCIWLRSLIAACLMIGASVASAERAVELTFLKSEAGKREALIQYIRANWFAMDAVAVERGLMTDYQLLDSGDDAGDWNVVVIVGYPDAKGYDGIREAFEAIRSAHVTVPVDGQTKIAAFGRVVSSRRLLRRD